MHWRFPGVCSRWRKQWPERVGWRQWRVWLTTLSGNCWQLNGGSINQNVWVVPGTGIVVLYHEEISKQARRPCIVFSLRPTANEGWWAHQVSHQLADDEALQELWHYQQVRDRSVWADVSSIESWFLHNRGDACLFENSKKVIFWIESNWTAQRHWWPAWERNWVSHRELGQTAELSGKPRVKCKWRKCEWVFCELKCEPAHSWSIFRSTRSLPGATAFAHSWNFLSVNNMTCIPTYATRVSA